MLDENAPQSSRKMPDIPTQSQAQHASNDVVPHPEKPLWVVGVGAGAGGLEAIQLLFGSMPANTNLAFVICRRVQSGLADPLSDLLCTQTDMPVLRATDGTKVQAGQIYLVPPNSRMVLLKDKLVTFNPEVEDDETDSAIYAAVSPIDVLLHSLAASAGSAAVAVILSGNDEDGARGCASIREHGGLVLAQHPDSTEFAKMPGHVIAADLASAVAPPGAIADLIWRHVGKMQAPTSQKSSSRDDDALARITALLEARFAIDAQAYRPSLVARRVRRRLALSDAETLADYAHLLTGDEAELSALHDDLLIRVTAFFRDAEAFGVLAHEVVPALVASMSEDRPLRVWIPACASGEEAYSIAMLILDRIERTDAAKHLEILASDRHEPALEHARIGRYRRNRLSNVPPELINRYMEDDGECFKVGALLRRHVTFIAHDILRAPAPDDIDLVSCRNLLIYLAAAPREKALMTCSAALRSDGFLFLGPSEQPGALAAGLETIHGKWRIYRKIPPPPVDDALTKLSELRKRAPGEVIEPPENDVVPGAGPPTGDLGTQGYLEGVLVENQRMLESTIDTLLSSNDTLRRRNRDLQTENQRLVKAHAALDDIATMIAHDLKMPLSAVRRMAEQLRTKLAADEQTWSFLPILQSAQHQLVGLNRLIDDLLTYARQGPGDATEMQSVDVTDMLRETLIQIGLPKGIKVLIRPRSLTISTWRIPLACILRNLLGQAIERVGETEGAIRIDASSDDHLLEMTIADNGRQERDHAGELGLAIVRQLLDAAGGKLMSGANKSGAGYHVRFTWPIEGVAAQAAGTNSSQSA